MAKRKSTDTTKKPTPSSAATCSSLRRILAANFRPTVEMMRLAGISRLQVDKEWLLVQMDDGSVIGPMTIPDHDSCPRCGHFEMVGCGWCEGTGKRTNV